ncbi:MAG: hypothetical protein VYD71_02945 [Bacteroidota bacterium]|nr:hypothetical protein [Bacteroidota bacterium]
MPFIRLITFEKGTVASLHEIAAEKSSNINRRVCWTPFSKSTYSI